MKTILFVAGILVVCWLGFLTLQHLNMTKDMDSHHRELQEHDGILNGQYQNMDKKEDNIDKKIQMPYENKKTNQNTNLKRENSKDIPSSVEPITPPVSAEQPVKPNPSPPAKEPAKEPIKGKPQSNANESIVAYSVLDKDLVAIEAFQLNLFPQEAVVAFKLQ